MLAGNDYAGCQADQDRGYYKQGRENTEQLFTPMATVSEHYREYMPTAANLEALKMTLSSNRRSEGSIVGC